MGGRYYYGPVDPGYGSLGAGIAGGIQQGMGNFVGMKDRARQQKREDADDVRTADLDGQRKAMFDLELLKMNGGRGAAPTTQRTVQTGTPSIGAGPELSGPLFEDPNEPVLPKFGTSWLGEQAGQLQAPQFPQSMTVEDRDPRFRTIGQGDQQFHVEDPEYARTRQRDELDTDRRTRIGTTASAIRTRNPDMTEEEALAEAALLVDGVAKFGDLNREETFGQGQATTSGFAQFGNRGTVRSHNDIRPVPPVGAQETFTPRVTVGPDGNPVYTNFGNRGTTMPTGQQAPPPTTGAGAGGVTPTSIYTQKARLAQNYLTERQRIDEYRRNYEMSDAEYAEAVAAAAERWGYKDYDSARKDLEAGNLAGSGQLGVDLDISDDDEFASDDGHTAAQSRNGVGGDDTQAGAGAGQAGAGQAGAGQAGAGDVPDDAPLTKEEITAVQKRLQGRSPAQRDRILDQLNLTADQRRQINGGR
jgi:hypothetical protein